VRIIQSFLVPNDLCLGSAVDKDCLDTPEAGFQEFNCTFLRDLVFSLTQALSELEDKADQWKNKKQAKRELPALPEGYGKASNHGAKRPAVDSVVVGLTDLFSVSFYLSGNLMPVSMNEEIDVLSFNKIQTLLLEPGLNLKRALSEAKVRDETTDEESHEAVQHDFPNQTENCV
jgi:hypothetical protein